MTSLFVGTFIAFAIIIATHLIAYAITCMMIVTKEIAYDEFVYRQILGLTFMVVVILETWCIVVITENKK